MSLSYRNQWIVSHSQYSLLLHHLKSVYKVFWWGKELPRNLKRSFVFSLQMRLIEILFMISKFSLTTFLGKSSLMPASFVVVGIFWFFFWCLSRFLRYCRCLFWLNLYSNNFIDKCDVSSSLDMRFYKRYYKLQEIFS